MNFGADGRLYIAVGDNNTASNAQTLNNKFGKISRINTDGTIRPTIRSTPPQRVPIARSGPWGSATVHVRHTADNRSDVRHDVGNNLVEEINDTVQGGNYGWPTTEGPTTDPRFTGPEYAYHHTTGTVTGCAITGGAFYNPSTISYPSDYVADYFFATSASTGSSASIPSRRQ